MIENGALSVKSKELKKSKDPKSEVEKTEEYNREVDLELKIEIEPYNSCRACFAACYDAMKCGLERNISVELTPPSEFHCRLVVVAKASVIGI